MQSKLQALATRLTLAAFAATAIVATASASAATQPQPVRADVIYVHAFNAEADQVKLDSGMAQKLKTLAAGGSAANTQSRTATGARDEVADEIVRQLQAKGLHAERLDGPVPANVNALVVEGDFRKIDEGSHRRRLLIGLGAGKSEVGASVRVSYKPANGAAVPVRSFVADADSGHLPGMAETGGIGAAAGHLAAAAGTGAGLHGASALHGDGVEADAVRLGDAIAKEVAAAAMPA